MNSEVKIILAALISFVLILLDANGVIKVPQAAVEIIAGVFVSGQAIVGVGKSMAIAKAPTEISPQSTGSGGRTPAQIHEVIARM